MAYNSFNMDPTKYPGLPPEVDEADNEEDGVRAGIVIELDPGGKERIPIKRLKDVDLSIKIAGKEWGKVTIINGRVVLIQQNGQSIKNLSSDKVENVGPQGSVVVNIQEKAIVVENRYEKIKVSLEFCDPQTEDFSPVEKEQSWAQNALLRILDWLKKI